MDKVKQMEVCQETLNAMCDARKYFNLENEKCAVCGGSVDHDGYGECENCHKFFCVDHNTLKNGICLNCLEAQEENQLNKVMAKIDQQLDDILNMIGQMKKSLEAA